jgi:hypothetical protein
MSADPEICATCMWWHRQGSALAKLSIRLDVDHDVGTCQVSPPVPLPGFAAGVFPQVHANRTCGAWEDEDEGDGPDGGERMDHTDHGEQLGDKIVQLRAVA